MADYSQLKVNELKEILKERNLPLSGTKKEIISRLEADDAAKGDNDAKGDASGEFKTEDKSGDKAEDQTEGNGTKTTESNAPDTAAAAAAEATGDPSSELVVPKEPAPVTAAPADKAESSNGETPAAQSTEDKTAEVIAALEKKLERAKRFGNEDPDTEKRLARIKKFGLASLPSPASNSAKVSKKQQKKQGNAPKAAQGETKQAKPETPALSAEEEEKRRKRRERFAASA